MLSVAYTNLFCTTELKAPINIRAQVEEGIVSIPTASKMNKLSLFTTFAAVVLCCLALQVSF